MRIIQEGLTEKDIAIRVELTTEDVERILLQLMNSGYARSSDCGKCGDCGNCVACSPNCSGAGVRNMGCGVNNMGCGAP